VLTFQKIRWYNIHCSCDTYYHKPNPVEEREDESMPMRTSEQQDRKGLLSRLSDGKSSLK